MDNDYGTVIDPVCGMRVDPEASPFVHAVHGISYHFCTSVCRDQFMQHPDRYAIDEQDEAERMSEGEAGVRRTSAHSPSASRPSPSGRTASRP